MIKMLTGVITFLLILITSILVIIIVVPIGLLRYIPYKPLQILILKINESFGEITLASWKAIQNLMHRPKYVVHGADKLKKDIWQFTTIKSPIPAYLLFEPPKTLMHSTLFAPVLSATCNSVCTCIIFQ